MTFFLVSAQWVTKLSHFLALGASHPTKNYMIRDKHGYRHQSHTFRNLSGERSGTVISPEAGAERVEPKG